MNEQTKAPAPRPCTSCPYRRDVPSGIWAAEEYAKLPDYDHPTEMQPLGAFLCHQQDGRLCAGWVACHDMVHSLGLRMLALQGGISGEEVHRTIIYRTDVPIFASGAEAAMHGLRDLKNPDEKARKLVAKLERKLG